MARKKKNVEERRCKCCREALPPEDICLCPNCQAAGLGRHIKRGTIEPEELLKIAQRREMLGIPPFHGMDMAEISALAWLFRSSGYGSYGKFREYVRMTGKLPPVVKIRQK